MLTVVAIGQIDSSPTTGELNEIGPYKGTDGAENSSTEGGNIKEVDIVSQLPASSWAGFFGEVTGSIKVGDSDAIYDWQSAQGNYVYAAKDSIDFDSTWESAQQTELVGEYPFLDKAGTGASETFNESLDVDSLTQGSTVKDTAGALSLDGQGDRVWPTAFLSDGNDYFFASKVISDNSPEFFNGEVGNDPGFQMILPENGDDSTATEYQVFVELE
jgi:hypothetical protein